MKITPLGGAVDVLRVVDGVVLVEVLVVLGVVVVVVVVVVVDVVAGEIDVDVDGVLLVVEAVVDESSPQ